MRQRALQVVRTVGLIMVVLEVLYLIAGNLLLWTGGVARVLSGNRNAMVVQHGRAYTFMPGRIDVSNFAVRVQDKNTQFQLTVDHAQLDVELLHLLRKQFRSRRMRCEGLSFRFRHRVVEPDGMQARLATYPPILEFTRPFDPEAPHPPGVVPEKHAPWSVRFDGVEAQVKELWVLEHRWQGEGRASGGFQLIDMHTLQVWPSRLVVENGQLLAGTHVVSDAPHFTVNAEVASSDVHQLKGMTVFRPITGTLDFHAKEFSPALLALYVPGLVAQGRGDLDAHLRLESGHFGRDLRVSLQMDNARMEKKGFVYQGAPRLTALLDPSATRDADLPRLRLKAPGWLTVPVPSAGDAKVQLEGLQGELVFSSRDVASGFALKELSAQIKEGRVPDASAVRMAVASKATFIVGAALGEGPLLATGGVDHLPDVTIVRLGSARLGAAELHGAARHTEEGGWNGAAAGRIGPLHFGLHLKNGKFHVGLNGSDEWLDPELSAAGIRFDRPATTTL